METWDVRCSSKASTELAPMDLQSHGLNET